MYIYFAINITIPNTILKVHRYYINITIVNTTLNVHRHYIIVKRCSKYESIIKCRNIVW